MREVANLLYVHAHSTTVQSSYPLAWKAEWSYITALSSAKELPPWALAIFIASVYVYAYMRSKSARGNAALREGLPQVSCNTAITLKCTMWFSMTVVKGVDLQCFHFADLHIRFGTHLHIMEQLSKFQPLSNSDIKLLSYLKHVGLWL